jgi:hypothetical protein
VAGGEGGAAAGGEVVVGGLRGEPVEEVLGDGADGLRIVVCDFVPTSSAAGQSVSGDRTDIIHRSSPLRRGF